jgi:hypothetical protein
MQTSFRVPEHVHWHRFDLQLVVLDLRAGAYYGLNEVAATAFEELAVGRPTNEVVTTLLDSYDVDRLELERGIDKLVRDLVDRGLLV